MKANQIPRALYAMCLAAMVALSGCVFNVNRVTQQKSGQVSSAGLTQASVDMKDFSGNITVSGTADSLVKATVTVDEMATEGSSESAADQVSVMIAEAEGIGSVSFSDTGGDDLWELLRIQDITVICNSGLDVSAKTTSGNINLSGITGMVTLKTTSGNVTADVVSGCDISVTSGNIKVHVPKGFMADLELKTTSGKIDTPGGDHSHLNGGNAAIVISCTATSGNIRIEEYEVN